MSGKHSEAVIVMTEHLCRFGPHIPHNLKQEFIDSAAEIVAASLHDAELKAQAAFRREIDLAPCERERA